MFKFHEKIVQKRLIIVDRKINLSTFSETKDADKKRRNHAGTEGFLAQHPDFRNIIIKATETTIELKELVLADL